MQFAREQQQSVCRCRPPIVKSRRGQWVEEDMTMDSIDALEAQHTEQEVGNHYSTWDEYLRKLLYVDVMNVMERKNSNVVLYKDIT